MLRLDILLIGVLSLLIKCCLFTKCFVFNSIKMAFDAPKEIKELLLLVIIFHLKISDNLSFVTTGALSISVIYETVCEDVWLLLFQSIFKIKSVTL